DGSPTSASVTLLLVIDASSMIGSYTERFTVPFQLSARPPHTSPSRRRTQKGPWSMTRAFIKERVTRIELAL
ncbi:hypothetical protein, partial [Streptomyces sp. NPDC091649]|uniref:hypothetical protein n=1 Tax=Streptomyces sp. NPDC091649 TaxID=3366004 RepID=UPI0037FD82DE